MSLKRIAITICVLATFTPAVLFAGGQQEEDVPEVDEEYWGRGDLDDRYFDQTGDMVADPPVNEDEWVDPDTLIFAYSPTEDPAVYEEVWEDFVSYLEDELARNVQYFGVQSYAAQIEAMRAGRLHVSGFAAGNVEEAVNTAGFRPQTIMAEPDGSFGYRMEIITHEETDIETVDDLEGREVAFVSETSNSGYLAPRAILYEEFDMLPGEDFDFTFSGSHDNSILGVFNRDYDAAAIADNVLRRMERQDRLDTLDDFRFVYESQEFTGTAYGPAHNLHPDLQEDIKEAFLNYDFDERLLEEFDPRDQFIEVDYEEDWEVMRTVRRGSEEVAEILGE